MAAYGYVSDTTLSDTYGKGKAVGLANFWPLIGVAVIAMIIEIVGSSNQNADNFLTMPLLLSFSIIWGIFLVGPIRMSTSWVYLKAARKQKFEIADMFAVFKRNYWNAVLASVLTFIFIALGLLFFIIPGIIIMCRLVFVNYLIIDEKMEAMDAIRKSWDMTKGYSWTIFWMIVVAVLLFIAGLIVLGVGALVSVVWISAAFAVLYHSVSKKQVKAKK